MAKYTGENENYGHKAHMHALLELKTPAGQPAFKRGRPDNFQYPDAVALLRETLAAQPDKSVVAVLTGGFTNFDRLLCSLPDASSPLRGVELVAEKVRFLSVMGGVFAEPYLKKNESNIRTDAGAADRLATGWPTEIVFCGYEIGRAVPFPAESLNKDFEYTPCHPVKIGCQHHHGLGKAQPSFDLNSALYGVRPGKYYTLSEPGAVRFTREGRTRFKPDPRGKHRFLKFDESQVAAVRDILIELTSQPPAAK